MGAAGTRKSTAIKLVKRSISSAGYTTFAADKTSKEKFLMDLAGMPDFEASSYGRPATKTDFNLDQNLFGGGNGDGTDYGDPKEVFIVADEFNEFAGAGNTDFYTTLGNLWDWDDPINPFTQKFKTSQSVEIYQPTVSLLSGNTAENFSRAFPAESQGVGFLSRLLLIHGERTSTKLWRPTSPSRDETERLIFALRAVLKTTGGGKELAIDPEAEPILEAIYKECCDDAVDDPRFLSYSSRRFTQLLKLCIIVSVANRTETITRNNVIEAHTYLSACEVHMPKSMGEFGKAKHSPIADKIMNILNATTKALTTKELFIKMGNDIDAASKLGEILNSLTQQNKIQHIPNMGFLPKKDVSVKGKYVDWTLLTEEEQRDIGE